MKSKNKPKVLLALSGGVDSSVAALLLQKQGYEVIGAFMKNWSDGREKLAEGCAWKSEREIAIKIAKKLKIKFITFDFEKQYRRDIIKKMFKEYKRGITPNPDIDCNQKVKFPLLIKEAKKLGIKYIATGHYARIKKKKDRYRMLRAKDESKDQSYFLYRLGQKDLENTLFPIGDLSKKEVRKIAKKNNFPNYNKKSTVGICFIGKINLKKFLQKEIKPKKGKILDPKGNQIGIHDGIYYYTIGQRIGPRFGIDIKKEKITKDKVKRWYIARKNLKRNEIIAAPENHSINFRQSIIITQFHLIDEDVNKFKKKKTKVYSRIRNVGELLPSKLQYNKKTKQFHIKLKKPITGVSEGQAIVLYKGKKVLGGGVISFK